MRSSHSPFARSTSLAEGQAGRGGSPFAASRWRSHTCCEPVMETGSLEQDCRDCPPTPLENGRVAVGVFVATPLPDLGCPAARMPDG